MGISEMVRRLRDGIRRTWNSTVDHFHEAVRPLRDEYEHIRERIWVVRWIDGAVRKLGEDDAAFMAAAMAYYTLLSVFPLLLGVLALWGLILPSEAVQDRLIDFLERHLPWAVEFVEGSVDQMIGAWGIAAVLSLLGLLWSGSGMFGAMCRAINRAWGIQHDRPFFVRKLRDLSMVLGVGVVLVLALGATAILGIASETDLFSLEGPVSLVVRLLIFLLSVVMFLLLYKFIPNTKTSWRHVWPGAVVAAILFGVARIVFIFYLAQFARYETVYGPVASIIIFLVWVYICALILIIGAELSSEYARMHEEESDMKELQ